MDTHAANHFDWNRNPVVRRDFSPDAVTVHFGGRNAGPSAEKLAAELGYHEPRLVETQDVTINGGAVVLALGNGLEVLVTLSEVTFDMADDVHGDRVVGEYVEVTGYGSERVEVFEDGWLCAWAQPDEHEHSVLVAAASKHLDSEVAEAIAEHRSEQFDEPEAA